MMKMLSAIRFVCYALLIVGLGLLIELDIASGNFGESSHTEWFQQIALLFIILLTLIPSFFTSFKILLRGIAFLATVLLIREFNNFFIDYLFKNAWQMAVLMVSIPSLFYFYKNKNILWEEAKYVGTHYSSGIVFSGAIVLFIFSRLMGRKILWMTLLAENYERKVKDLIEESIESLGYALLFIGILEMLFFIRKKRRG